MRCTSARSALEALRNALYKFSTYLLAYLLTTVTYPAIESGGEVCDVSLSVREHVSGAARAIFTKFLCMLLMAVARSSSGRVTKSQEEGAILGVFLFIDNTL